MALSKITYANKSALNPQPSIADENKVTDANMNEIKSVVNNAIDQVDANTTNIGNITGTILWTNPNPNNLFPAQSINLSNYGYDVLEIFYYDFNAEGKRNVSSTRAKKGSNINLMAIFQYNDHGYIGNRNIYYVNDTTLNVDVPVSIIQSDTFNRQAVQDWCVPLYIIGYKTGLFN